MKKGYLDRREPISSQMHVDQNGLESISRKVITGVPTRHSQARQEGYDLGLYDRTWRWGSPLHSWNNEKRNVSKYP